MTPVMGFCGCGGGAHDSIAVRVGPAVVTSATVEHWMSAMAGGRVPSDPSRRQALRRQALDFLISSEWLLGEATADGIELPSREVERQFEQKRRTSFPGGAAELHEFLMATGQNISDIMFEAKAELASAKIRQLLARGEPAITQAQVASYFDRHRQGFLIPERRELEIIALKSAADAQTLRREVATGKSFAGIAEHQSIELSPEAYNASRGKDAVLARAIHFAPPHVLVGPVRFRGFDYYMFEVLRITPARQQTLAQVQSSIRRQLAGEQQRRTLAAFIRTWRRRWTARTDCHAGYVVPKCRQYKPPSATPPEDPYSLT